MLHPKECDYVSFSEEKRLERRIGQHYFGLGRTNIEGALGKTK